LLLAGVVCALPTKHTQAQCLIAYTKTDNCSSSNPADNLQGVQYGFHSSLPVVLPLLLNGANKPAKHGQKGILLG
jgi:hypothetical protein